MAGGALGDTCRSLHAMQEQSDGAGGAAPGPSGQGGDRGRGRGRGPPPTPREGHVKHMLGECGKKLPRGRQ